MNITKLIWFRARVLQILKSELDYNVATPGHQQESFNRATREAYENNLNEYDSAIAFMLITLSTLTRPIQSNVLEFYIEKLSSINIISVKATMAKAFIKIYINDRKDDFTAEMLSRSGLYFVKVLLEANSSSPNSIEEENRNVSNKGHEEIKQIVSRPDLRALKLELELKSKEQSKEELLNQLPSFLEMKINAENIFAESENELVASEIQALIRCITEILEKTQIDKTFVDALNDAALVSFNEHKVAEKRLEEGLKTSQLEVQRIEKESVKAMRDDAEKKDTVNKALMEEQARREQDKRNSYDVDYWRTNKAGDLERKNKYDSSSLLSNMKSYDLTGLPHNEIHKNMKKVEKDNPYIFMLIFIFIIVALGLLME